MGSPRHVDLVDIGQVLLGKYRVESLLGLGGMGVVAQCMHIELGERVAIKMMRPDMTDPGAADRFVREARAAAKLKSEYVVRVSDVGSLEDGMRYMVMEYLEGQDLGKLIEQRGPISTSWVADLMLQAAEALSEAHSIDIVHRDVKPTNLFVTQRPDGTSLMKVLDFGVSKAHVGADVRLTNTQSLLGTPAYMSPEQMRSARSVDPRTDIWSLGIVMYELLEGRRPFDAENFTELVVRVSMDPPLPMQTAPLAMQRVVMRCLEKVPDQRYQTMAELARDLLPFVPNRASGELLVQRVERVLRRAVTPPVLPVEKKWLDAAAPTEPDVQLAKVLAPPAPPVVPAPPAPPVVPAPPAPPVVPAPPAPPIVAAPATPTNEPVATDADTVYVFGSTHVPFTDRRQDDLAPTPLPRSINERAMTDRITITRRHGPQLALWLIILLLMLAATTVGVVLGLYH